MTNQLAKFNSATSDLATLKRSKFLPAIRISAGESAPTKLNLFPSGQLYIHDSNPNKCLTLGTERAQPLSTKANTGCFLDVLCGPWRMHAILLVKNEVEAESFNMSDPTFARIKSMRKDQEAGIVPMVGADVLFYVPPGSIDFSQLDSPRRSLKESEKQELREQYSDGFLAILFYKDTFTTYIPHVHTGKAICISTGMIGNKQNTWWVPIGAEEIPQPEWFDRGMAMLQEAAPAFTEVVAASAAENVVERSDNVRPIR